MKVGTDSEAQSCVPVDVLSAVAHAVDAVVAWKGSLHRLLQGLVVVSSEVGSPTKLATHQPH